MRVVRGAAVGVALALLGALWPMGTGTAETTSAGVSEQSSGTTPSSVGRQQSSSGQLYFDVCDDADGSPIDLRRVDLTSHSTSGELTFSAESCAPWSLEDLGDGRLEWLLTTDGGPPDYAVRVAAGDGVEPVLEVVPDPESEGAAPTFTGEAEQPPAEDGYVVQGRVPTEALDGHTTFDFELRSEDAAGRRDRLPETAQGEGLVDFPNRCQAITVERSAVRTEPGRHDEAVAAARAAGLEVVTEAPETGVFSARTPPGVARFADRSTLAGLPGVAEVHRPVPVERLGPTPTAPRYPEQWALPAVRAPEAWDVRTGSGVEVAVIDDGVDAGREVLAGRVAAGHDTMFDRPLPAGTSSDRGGHGTAVAGVLGADGQAGADVAGLDWGAEIVPYRIFDAAGCGTDVEIAAALEHAAARGVGVANLSIGTTQDSAVLADAVGKAIDAGVTIVAAVGNSKEFGNRPVYPAFYDEVIGVGATTRDGERAAYSNTGNGVHVVAPGGDGSETPEGDLLVLGERDGVVPTSGTSFATPLVAGAVALHQAEAPDVAPDDLLGVVASTATDLGEPGPDDAFGHGQLDVAALLRRAHRTLESACPDGEVPSSGFTDVAGNVHRDRIDCVVWYGVARGVTETSYEPASGVTREQMATFLARLLTEAGIRLPEPTNQGFVDLTGGPHDDAIRQLAEVGVVNGTSSTRYSPSQRVRRDQMASFLVRAYEEAAGALPSPGARAFDDIDGNVHAQAIDKAAEAGFAEGVAPRSYAPHRTVRRDQMASFLGRVLDRFAVDGRLALPS